MHSWVRIAGLMTMGTCLISEILSMPLRRERKRRRVYVYSGRRYGDFYTIIQILELL
jgi:hypothetical protein